MNKLIFDIGCNNGADSLFYSRMGYNVVAVDADPELIKANTVRYDGVSFINAAISDKDGETVPFFVAADNGHSSISFDIANKNNGCHKIHTVPTRTLKSLFEQYGTPYYCKIDIEGHDVTALKSISGAKELPKYISVESECKPDSDKLSEDGIFDTLYELKRLGYTKFKLVDQTTLKVLGCEDYYLHRTKLWYKIIRKLQKTTGIYSTYFTNKQRLSKKHGYQFTNDSSGVFGEDLDGKWLGYWEAIGLYLFHRRQFYAQKENKCQTFWCDWHATGVDITARHRQDAVSDTRQFVGAASRLKRLLG